MRRFRLAIGRLGWVTWLGCMVGMCGLAQSADAPVAPTTVLVMGDSLSAGFGIDPEQGWVALLQRRLAAQGYPVRVVNASVSGETSSGGLALLPAVLAQVAPKVVVIELGANDGLRGLPVQVLRDNLTAMVKAAQAAGARVLLLRMRLPPNFGPYFGAAFQRSYADVAQATGATLGPFLLEGFADQLDQFQADGLHPVAGAQPLIVATVWPALLPLLPSPRS